MKVPKKQKLYEESSYLKQKIIVLYWLMFYGYYRNTKTL